MSRARLAGALVGIVFGLTLSWSGMASPTVIRGALLVQDAYLYLMFASAVLTASIGLTIVRRVRTHAALTGDELTFPRERPARRHIVGSLLFGVGWAVADACPGPVAAQIGQGIPWAVFTLVGVAGGIWIFQRQGASETEPASDQPTPGLSHATT